MKKISFQATGFNHACIFLLLILSMWFSSGYIFAQTTTSAFSLTHVDSLRNKFKETQNSKLLQEILSDLNFFMNKASIPLDDIERNLGFVQECIKKDQRNKFLTPEVNLSFAFLYVHKGKQAKAMEFFEKTINFYKSNKDTISLVNTYNQMGGFFYNLNQIEASLDFLKEARNYTTPKLKKTKLYRNILNTEGLAFKKMKSYDRAEQLFYQALVISKELSDTAWIGLVSGNLATIYVAKGRLSEAIPLLETDIKYSLKTQLYMSAAFSMAELGRIYIVKKQYAKAKVYLDSTIHFIDQYGASDLVTSRLRGREMVYMLYATLYTNQRNFEKAFFYQTKLLEIKDSINLVNKSKELELITGKYEYEDARKELKILAKENALKESYLYLVAVILTMIAVVSIILFRNNKTLKEKQKEIELQKEDLEKLNETKNLLISVIGHDFRSPLVVIQGILQLLNNQTLSQDDVKPYYPEMLDKVENTLNFLDSLLRWIKLQMQGIEVKPVHLNLTQIVAQIIALKKGGIENKKIVISNKIEQPINVFADEEMLKTILRNLISNAIKFTPQQGKITVDAQISSNFVQISITDTGVGIDNKTLSNLFTKKIQSTQGTSLEKGTGFGLLFCKEFVEKNNGKIWVESQESVGSTFYFTIPLVQQEELIQS